MSCEGEEEKLGRPQKSGKVIFWDRKRRRGGGGG